MGAGRGSSKRAGASRTHSPLSERDLAASVAKARGLPTVWDIEQAEKLSGRGWGANEVFCDAVIAAYLEECGWIGVPPDPAALALSVAAQEKLVNEGAAEEMELEEVVEIVLLTYIASVVASEVTVAPRRVSVEKLGF